MLAAAMLCLTPFVYGPRRLTRAPFSMPTLEAPAPLWPLDLSSGFWTSGRRVN